MEELERRVIGPTASAFAEALEGCVRNPRPFGPPRDPGESCSLWPKGGGTDAQLCVRVRAAVSNSLPILFFSVLCDSPT